MKINPEAIKKQIFLFYNNLIDEEKYIIGALRYGAHIPHIYQNVCLENKQTPKKINLILSHMLNFFPKDFYEGKSFIVLDDTIYEGNEMKRLVSLLEKKLGVPKKNIQTAALAINEYSSYKPDIFLPNSKYQDPEYIAWKEVLASMIINDIRPTDRDHPLYFFNIFNIGPGKFINILEQFGTVHSTGRPDTQVFRFSLTFDTQKLCDQLDIPSVDFGSVYKIRFYWKQQDGYAKLTIVPMGFPIINVKQFISSCDGSTLAKLLGLQEDFYKRIYQSNPNDSREEILFYYASRGISLLFLRSFLFSIYPLLLDNSCILKIIPPCKVDMSVNYVFPDDYHTFYNNGFQDLENIVNGKDRKETSLFPNFSSSTNINRVSSQKHGSSKIQNVVGFFARNGNLANWNGERWIPNKTIINEGYTYKELFQEFPNHTFLSRALDELLESGLLRAKDLRIREKPDLHTRHFLPGGEYNAIHMQRIADNQNNIISNYPVDPQIIEENAIELWGPD